MTDRQAGYVVTLERDIRDDDAARIIDALGMIKGVLTVTPIGADTFQESIFLQRWKSELRAKLLAAVE